MQFAVAMLLGKMHVVLHWEGRKKIISVALRSISLAMFSEYSRRVSVKQCRHKTFVQLPLSCATLSIDRSLYLCAQPTIFHTQTMHMTSGKCQALLLYAHASQVCPSVAGTAALATAMQAADAPDCHQNQKRLEQEIHYCACVST